MKIPDPDFTGKRIGDLLLLSWERGEGRFLYNCICDCGNEVKVKHIDVKLNRRSSCGCRKFRYGKNNPTFNGCNEISGHHIANIKQNAKKRNIDFNITAEILYDIFKNQSEKCYFSGDMISFSNKTASVDRLNPKLGYIEHNICIVHKNINKIKLDNTENNFIQWCNLISGNCNNIDNWCLNNEKYKWKNACGKKSSTWKGYEDIPKDYFSSVKRGAIKRKIKFNISIENFWAAFYSQNKKCAITNLDIGFKNNGFLTHTASVDRIDSSVGYEVDNIQFLHKNVNKMKWDFEQKYFIDLCRKVSNYAK